MIGALGCFVCAAANLYMFVWNLTIYLEAKQKVSLAAMAASMASAAFCLVVGIKIAIM